MDRGMIIGGDGEMPDGLAELFGRLNGSGSNESPDSMTDADLVEVLRSSESLLDAEHTFTPGQLVRTKKGVEDGYRKPRGGALMFRRMMTEEEKAISVASAVENHTNDHAFIAASRDCVCARVVESGAVMEFPTTMRYLEPHPDY